MPPEWGANALLHPARRPLTRAISLPHRDSQVRSEGLHLKGWYVPAQHPRGVLIVYLHGIGDNRQSGIGVAERFGPLGYDVALFDSRAHGESEGDACTYGYHEKNDVFRIMDGIGTTRVVLFGSSLGAAVALQAAPLDHRVIAVIAQSSFSDLNTIARDRAPFLATEGEIRQAIALAEERGNFKASEVSPVDAARSIHVPVLLIHGAIDRETSPSHSEKIAAALSGKKELFLVPGAGHNDVLSGEEPWRHIAAFLAQVSAGP